MTILPQHTRFPWRGTLYRIDGHLPLPSRHVILPDGRVLVVCSWTGRIPNDLADVRRASQSRSQCELVRVLKGVPAYEITPEPGETLDPTVILDFEGTRYAVPEDAMWSSFIELPDRRLLRSEGVYLEARRIAEITVVDRESDPIKKASERFGIVRARAVSPRYAGMPAEPNDLRIRIYHQDELYILSHEAYERGLWQVYIPDVGFFRIGSYLESSPVKVGGLMPMTARPTDMSQVAVALPVSDAVDAIDYRRRAIESASSSNDEEDLNS